MADNVAEAMAKQADAEHKDEREVVWVKCRAKASCEGNTAWIVRRQRLQGGPVVDGGGGGVTYQCCTCKGGWGISY